MHLCWYLFHKICIFFRCCMQSAVSLGGCSVYSHITCGSEDPTPLISLLSPLGVPSEVSAVSLSLFFYFFLDRHSNRLLMFACTSQCKLGSPSWFADSGAVEEDAGEEDVDDVHIGKFLIHITLVVAAAQYYREKSMCHAVEILHYKNLSTIYSKYSHFVYLNYIISFSFKDSYNHVLLTLIFAKNYIVHYCVNL